MTEIKLVKELEDFIESMNFSVTDVEEYDEDRAVLTVGQYTPEGEDWHETFELGDRTYGDLIDDIKQRSAYFDVDEEVEPYVANRGHNGVPTSIKALVEDAEWKGQTLREFAEAIEDKFSGMRDANTVAPDLSKDLLYTLKQWYRDEYPQDTGVELANVDFYEVYNSLGKQDIYTVMGVNDSVVRERLFKKLSELTGFSENSIYETWLKAEGGLPPLRTAQNNGRGFLPFNVREPEFNWENNGRSYVEYAVENIDETVIYERSGLGEEIGYSSYEQVRNTYPEAHLNVYVKVYEDKEVSMTVFFEEESLERYINRDIDLTENEKKKILNVVAKDLELTGENLLDHLEESTYLKIKSFVPVDVMSRVRVADRDRTSIIITIDNEYDDIFEYYSEDKITIGDLTDVNSGKEELTRSYYDFLKNAYEGGAERVQVYALSVSEGYIVNCNTADFLIQAELEDVKRAVKTLDNRKRDQMER